MIKSSESEVIVGWKRRGVWLHFGTWNILKLVGGMVRLENWIACPRSGQCTRKGSTRHGWARGSGKLHPSQLSQMGKSQIHGERNEKKNSSNFIIFHCVGWIIASGIYSYVHRRCFMMFCYTDMHVWVNHLKRRKTSTLFSRLTTQFWFCRGATSCLQLIAQRRGLHSWLIWLGRWSHVPAYNRHFLRSFFPGKWPPAKPRTGMSITSISIICQLHPLWIFLYGSRNLLFMLRFQSRSLQLRFEFEHLWAGSASFTHSHSCQVNWVVFARLMSFHIPIRKDLSEQVCYPCRLDKMTWAFRGRPVKVVFWILDLISDFTHFNAVIRLRKVKQLAFSRFHPVGRRLNNVPLYRASIFQWGMECTAESRETYFFNGARETEPCQLHFTFMLGRSICSRTCVWWSCIYMFGVFWERFYWSHVWSVLP